MRDGDLSHSEAQKKKAAAYIEEHLGPGTTKAGVIADGDSETVAGGSNATACTVGKLSGWGVQKGLSHRMGRWQRNAKRLTGRLEAELTGLRQANTFFQDNESDTAASFDGTSPLYRSALLDYVPSPGPTPGPGTGRPAAKSPIADF
ncbi:hypothetical protein CUT44_11910 [Streptomyces carminius]|uniref:Uncharacterized protein n=1 Tax=Streptomyces carminius TaxID=2665496 RepID=A0A2M8LZK2_9ACTN|nr:hypothetical protein [Streptomyces carminius]PJE97388.1 hypothetical protein CUT44_11910 [Streptomyces carminius]